MNIDHHVILDTYFQKNEAVVWSETNSLFHLRPLIKLEELLKKIKRIPGITVYTKSTIPEYFHYKNSTRVGDILLHANEGVSLLYLRNKLLKNGTKRYKAKNRYVHLIADSIKAK